MRVLDDRQNKIMIDFTRRMMDAINSSDVAALECYHSMIWDSDKVLEPILESQNIEFWSVHAPYGRLLDSSSPDPDIRDAAFKACCSGINVANRLGAKVVVVHPGSKSDYEMPHFERLKLVPEVMAKVADYAAEYDIKIAVEPLPNDEVGCTLEEVLWILDEIDRPNAGVNFDVNHLFPAVAIPGMIKKAGKRIFSTHISDQDDHERHWLPFEGKLDWGAVLEAFIEIGYQGPLIYETHIKNVQTPRQAVQLVVDNYNRLIKLPVGQSIR